jgi:ABC-type sugar transport system ATPase subunit
MSKAFGATQALRDASFELRSGEVHALVGENGSGKSTFVKILSGIHAADAGTVELFGASTQPPRSPGVAISSGVVTVFQEVLVAGARSVLENVWLGSERALRTSVPRREREDRATAVLTDLLAVPPRLDVAVEELSLSLRQTCGIARALLREPRILILDEATSALDVATRDQLFALLGRLTQRGVGVIFITHRLDEISEIGDRITVMRSGTTVATLERNAWTPRQLIRLMTGTEHLAAEATVSTRAVTAERSNEPIVRVRDLRLAPGAAAIDLDIRRGEVVGVAGLEAHGQDQFLQALRGARRAATGTIVRVSEGREVPIRNDHQAASGGVFYVPRERARDCAFAWMSIRENFGLPTLTLDDRLGILSHRSTVRRLGYYVDRLRVVLGDPNERITTLSGGNQQKVMIARWLAANPQLLILNDPTRGIDIGAKRDLYEMVATLAGEGLSVVMLSTELDEHVELMDRVLVFREFGLFRTIERSELSRESLVAAFFGEAPVGD